MSNKSTYQNKQFSQKNINKSVTNQNENNNIHKEDVNVQEDKPNYFLYPIFIILCIVPFIVRMKVYNTNMSQFAWFSSSEQDIDYFLYYRQWTFIITAALMAIIVALKAIFNRHKLKCSFVFIPLAVYALLALLSALFSKYSDFCYSGSYQQFESVFALLGYCMVVYYIYLFINTERDIKIILIFIIATACIMSILGICQYFGHDFFTTEIANKFIIPIKFQDSMRLNPTMGANTVYLSFYNPDYVGIYTALVAPVIAVLIFFQKKIWIKILSVLVIIGLVICTVGATAQGGIIALGVAALCFIILMWRYLLKYFYITIPVALILMVGAFLYFQKTDNAIVNKLHNYYEKTKTEYTLTNMEPTKENVTLTYKGNVMKVYYLIGDNQTASFVVLDGNDQLVEGAYDPAGNVYVITDARFAGMVLGSDTAVSGVFYIQIDGRMWKFTNQVEQDGSYHYVNSFYKVADMINAPSAIFTGHEPLASNRGYIWSRTLPMLKNYILLGSGPDTFTMAFPQNDYLNRIQSGYESTVILTKPHNMYLQIGVQTGLISLIAFLLFYLMYFISSIRLYIRGLFNSIYARVGVGIFVGTISYMVIGLVNDSSITTAPIFWTLIGVGIAVNHKAKPLIREELAEIKRQRDE